MSISKKFLKSKPICKVTFRLSKEQAAGAEKVALVGGFNDWNTTKNYMKKLKDGSFKTVVELAVDNAYEFRYLLNEKNWLTDSEADAYVNNGIDNQQNAVVDLQQS